MKQSFIISLVIFICTGYTFGQNAEQTDQIIMKLKNEIEFSSDSMIKNIKTGNAKIDSITIKMNALAIEKQSIGGNFNKNIYIIKFPKGTSIDKVIDLYIKTGEIEYAEPDFKGSTGGKQSIIPNDQYYSRQWGLKNNGTFSLSPSIVGADIDIENAWTIEQGDSNIIVSIIDSGTKLDHPDLAGRIWTNKLEIPNNGIDDDFNGYIDDEKGWDFVNSDNKPTDDNGHGTNVAGIVGANTNNSIGYAGVDWKCKLMILKVTDNTGYGYYSNWANAIYYATANGARVINMSLGGTSFSSTLQNAVNYALNHNVSVVVCMMNTNSSTINYPAGFSGVIAVGSTNANDKRSNPFFWDAASGSNYGNHISVTAPGNYIYGLNYLSNSNYGTYWGGTSQATPLVAGLASLLYAQNPSKTPAQIKSIIESSADDLVGDPSEDTPGWDKYYGFGRINAYKALSGITNSKLFEANIYEVVLSPNPTKQNFSIQFPLGTKEIHIFNSIGKLIQTKNVDLKTSQNFQLAEKGIYFITVRNNNQAITKKLIVTGN